MRYNTELKKLIIPEYGRHIHEIIDNLCKIEDPKKEMNKRNYNSNYG